MIGRKKSKGNEDIAREWNSLAVLRANQFLNNEDLSMDYVLVPLLSQMIQSIDCGNVLDAGCGTGYATHRIAETAKKFKGIDISASSIEATTLWGNSSSTVEYEVVSIEDYSLRSTELYTLVIANMVLMDVVNLDDVVKSISSLLVKGGKFVFTITHPCFWPTYWNYADESWFHYNKEIEIEGVFNISLKSSNKVTTHYHRPLEMYVNCFARYGLQIINLFEPVPSFDTVNKFPREWRFPRFLGARCTKL